MSRSHRRPSGLVVPTHAALEGRVRWQVIDEYGVPEVPRSPSGFAVAPIEGGEQSNLITNFGLDAIATSALDGILRGSLAVGEGSSAPDVGDIALDSEVQRSNQSGGASSITHRYDAIAEEFVREDTQRRQVTMSANRVLTEFGFAPGADLTIRELFRDSEGNPVAISLLNGKTINVTHTLSIRIAAPPGGTPINFDIEEYDAANNLVNTIPVSATWGPYASNFASNALQAVFTIGWRPNGTTVSLRPFQPEQTYSVSNTPSVPGGSASVTTGTLLPYTPGTYKRTKRAVVVPALNNIAWGGFGHYGFGGGYACLFDSPASWTKVNTDTVTVLFESSWGRA